MLNKLNILLYLGNISFALCRENQCRVNSVGNISYYSCFKFLIVHEFALGSQRYQDLQNSYNKTQS